MFTLNVQNDVVFLRDIKSDNLPYILKWYNKVDDFKFATGIDVPISLETLTRKYAEVAICSNEFFVGVYTRKDNKMVGILKGMLKYKNRDAMWISSIAVDINHQKMGYGRAAVELLLKHLSVGNGIRSAYLAVVEENTQGRAFWNKLNFRELRRIENHLKLQDKQRNVIIMYRQL